MAVDLSFFSYILPILTFLVVFMVGFALISKLKLFDKPFWNLFLAFLVSTIFITASGPVTYVQNIVPWFVILLVSFFLIMALFGMTGFSAWKDNLSKGFAIVLLALFVISGIFVFSSYFAPYLPWNSGVGANEDVKLVSDWIFSPRVWGAILMIGITALVSYFLVKSTGSSGGKGK